MSKIIESYQSELGEKAVKLFLEKLHNLKLKKLPEIKGQKTADYELLDEQKNRVAVCEVKSLVGVPSEEFDYKKPVEESRKRDKNYRSKLRRQLDSGLSQLVSYKDLPKIIFFASFDMTDYIDMAQVLQEDEQLYPASPKADLYIIIKIHQPLIPSDNFTIKETTRKQFNTEVGKEFAEKYLSSSEASIKGGTLPIIFNLN